MFDVDLWKMELAVHPKSTGLSPAVQRNQHIQEGAGNQQTSVKIFSDPLCLANATRKGQTSSNVPGESDGTWIWRSGLIEVLSWSKSYRSHCGWVLIVGWFVTNIYLKHLKTMLTWICMIVFIKESYGSTCNDIERQCPALEIWLFQMICSLPGLGLK